MPAAFQPFKLKDVTLRNRIAVPPMCQYSAKDGFTNEWHWAHYAGLARGGAGLVVVEATGVSADGRITPGCTGLWKDEQIEGMARIAASIRLPAPCPVSRSAMQAARPARTSLGRRRSYCRGRPAWLGNHLSVGDRLRRRPVQGASRNDTCRYRTRQGRFRRDGQARPAGRIRMARTAFRPRLSGPELLFGTRQQAYRCLWW